MRVMVLVKATKDSEAGVMPSTELLEAMQVQRGASRGRHHADRREGLKPSSEGKRVAFDGVSRAVIRALRRNRRARRRLLAVAGQGHGRGGRMGEALP